MVILMIYCLDILKGICGYLLYKLCFYDSGFLVNLQMKLLNFRQNFQCQKLFEFMILYRSSNIRFSKGLRYQYVLRVLGRCFEKPGSTQRHTIVATCSTSELQHDTYFYRVQFFACISQITPSMEGKEAKEREKRRVSQRQKDKQKESDLYNGNV